MSKLAHACGALLFVDAAQLAPHRPIDMQRDGVDALAFSAHKVYAPFGIGVLALPEQFLDALPVDPGGGSIDMISESSLLWAPPHVRHQTGTWNVAGILALSISCEILTHSWHEILDHEKKLIRYTAAQLAEVPDLALYVQPEKYGRENRIGTFPFSLKGYHHALLAAILEHEWGIETRAGTICNHRLVRRWFNVSDEKQYAIECKIAHGDRLASYGIVRASLGVQNTIHDIDRLVTALRSIQKDGSRLDYTPLPKEETFIPKVVSR